MSEDVAARLARLAGALRGRGVAVGLGDEVDAATALTLRVLRTPQRATGFSASPTGVSSIPARAKNSVTTSLGFTCITRTSCLRSSARHDWVRPLSANLVLA